MSARRFATHLVLPALFTAALLWPAAASGQEDDELRLPPSNIILPNYDSIPVGQIGGLEAGAYVARVDDDTANWYNPAGLARARRSSISTSAGTYQLLSLDIEALPDKGHSTQQVPAGLGILIQKPFGNDCWDLGILLVRTNSWLQQTDSQLGIIAPNGTGDLITYSADSQFDRVEGSLGVSYSAGGPWRFGAALSGVYTYLRAVQAFSQSIVLTGGLAAASSAGRTTGGLGQGRLALGVQYDFSPEFKFGALARTTGVTVIRDGGYTIDALVSQPPLSGSLSLFDPEIRFDYKLPWEFVVGGAYERDTYELEVDVKLYTGHSTYSAFHTDVPAIRIVSNGQGTPQVDEVPVADLLSTSRTVVNVAAGGHWIITRNRVWRLHFGFGTDFSPVGDDDDVFSQVNLYNFRAGVSGEALHFVGSLGIQYTFGSATVPFERILNQTTTRLDVSSLGFLYSIGYRF